MTTRTLTRIIEAEPVTDGDGVKINRSVARGALGTLDPFLLLDELGSDEAADYIGGFPEHPHRGFETVTYMREGMMEHRDHMGNVGRLEPGSVQWMTAGRGVLHSEMPLQDEGRLHGFQLWINLPAAQKMSAPNYREYHAGDIAQLRREDGTLIKVLAGTATLDEKTATGPVQDVSTHPQYFDVSLPAGATLALPVAHTHRALIYVYEGKVRIGKRELQAQQLGELTGGDSLNFSAIPDSALLILTGAPIGEPVANWGPFVMNTQEEIEQAIKDYRSGTLVQ